MGVKLISSFTGNYSFLSNFYYSPIEFEGLIYPSAEHAFQAAKTNKIEIKKRIQATTRPYDAKKIGRSLKRRPEWEDIKFLIMERILREKFKDPDLMSRLIDTYPKNLVEGNSWGDKIWGAVQTGDRKWEGANMLGVLLMKIRGEVMNRG